MGGRAYFRAVRVMPSRFSGQAAVVLVSAVTCFSTNDLPPLSLVLLVSSRSTIACRNRQWKRSMRDPANFAPAPRPSVRQSEYNRGLLPNLREALGHEIWLWPWPGLGRWSSLGCGARWSAVTGWSAREASRAGIAPLFRFDGARGRRQWNGYGRNSAPEDLIGAV